MARTKRICPAGEVFHVLNRAVARLTIFEKPEDYAAFLSVVEETWEIVPLPIYGNRVETGCHPPSRRQNWRIPSVR
jgi:putative transposase